MNLDDALGEAPAVAPLDLTAPVVFLPIRHHSPACAHHVGQVVRQLRPASVLVEGPRDATPLIPLLLDPRTSCPVALYTVYVDRRGEGLPRRHGAYYPLSDFSPEMEALRAARMVGAEARFIDLTYPEMVQAEGEDRDTAELAEAPARSLQAEAYLRRSRFLHHACVRAGARDPDDLWDCLFEHDFRDKDPARFFREVLAWCALARRDHPEEQLVAEAHPAREAAMRHETEAALAAAGGRPVVVVTGGFHTVALPTTTARRPPPVTLSRPDDATVTLMRYGFVQLDRLNGYASGMPSPEFYQRLWEGRDAGALVIEVARALRERGPGPSTADAIAALAHVRGLAHFREHRLATREDVLDGIRSCFVKGADDVEGIAVLAQARKQLAGERIGQVPPDAGRPPLVLDFERQLAILRLSLEASREHETSLDLYRSAAHRARSRLFHRLRLLGVPFARLLSGPDYVAGKDLERVRETWSYGWQPAVEAVLVEQSRYGATVEEAAASLVLERFAAAEQGDRRSDRAAQLLLEACRCGLHARAPDLLARTAALMSADPSFPSVARGVLELDLLRLSREPLEANHLVDLPEAVRRGWERAAALVSHLAATGDTDETDALDQLCAWSTLAPSLPDPDLAAAQRRESLEVLLGAPAANPTLLGAAAGLLFDDGALAGAELGRRLAGLLHGATGDPAAGARFLRGVLRAARAACWLEPSLLESVHATLRDLTDDTFVSSLPHLRLAFADLTPRECDRVAAAVAVLGGQARLDVRPVSATEEDLLVALRADRLVRERLEADGLTAPGVSDG
jgi:hypothetical protein